MLRPHVHPAAALLALGLTAGAASVQVLPTDFDGPASPLTAQSAYFGGVASFGVALDPTVIHSGPSLRCWANFRHDDFFRLAGFTVGASQMAPPAYQVPAAAQVFSITVRTPDLLGKQLRMKVTVREDDNADGVIDTAGADDEWEAIAPLTAPGTQVFNVPLSAFADTNPGIGNGVQNFATTPRMTFNLTFETRQDLPGGIIEFPVSLLIDHVGFFRGPQAIPAPPCRADYDGRNGADLPDIFAFLADWFALAPRADFDGQNGVDLGDVFAFLTAWFAGC
jgi:hypothetical protein